MGNCVVVIAIDPGLTGGISVLDKNKEMIVCKMPVKPIVVNKKKKNTYDMVEIIKLFSSYKDKKVLFFIEKQGVRRGEGSVSAMTIGKNYGQLLGAAYAFNFDVVEVTPQKWKKQFPELVTQGIIDKKAEIKELRISFKEELEKLVVLGKTLKDKGLKKQNKEQIKILEKESKKQIDKINRQVKAEAKTNARELVMHLYPKMADKFVKKNTDGLSESVLIALYGKENQNELV
ncbi:MAG TPA: hypothetical protein VMZ91_00460 [Candidatus Paceibacterota bacterium]|nr:hypothetical protein [Candidatus Paceibacterota bacterium]